MVRSRRAKRCSITADIEGLSLMKALAGSRQKSIGCPTEVEPRRPDDEWRIMKDDGEDHARGLGTNEFPG